MYCEPDRSLDSTVALGLPRTPSVLLESEASFPWRFEVLKCYPYFFTEDVLYCNLA